MKISKYIKSNSLILALSILMVGCIENDLPYPDIQANFTNIKAEHQYQDAVIDSVNRTVTLFLTDTADIKNVNITEYTLSEGATLVSPEITGGIDLSQPLNVTLKLYREYNWEISAVQPIERYFTFDQQVGTAIIDVENRYVKAYISKSADITKVTIKSIKLGSSQSTISLNINDTVIDFSNPVTVYVNDYGRTEEWTICIENKSVKTSRIDAWSQVAWVYGIAEAGNDNGVEYRLASDSEWTKVPAEWVTHDDGNFTARIIHLEPNTTYIARSYSNNEYGEDIEFTTGAIVQVPNSSFDEWWQDGKVWCPWTEGGQPYWGTGNKGAATVGQSNSVPTDDTATGPGLAAKLETKYIVIRLAAGNIFTGDYVKTDGTNGILDFGREFNQRPTKLKGYYKYDCKTINKSNSSLEVIKNMVGQPDTCSVWIALTDWETPFQIRTNPKDQQLFDENASHVIAYGRFQMGENNPKYPNYEPFEVMLNYRDTQRVPKYIVIAASASKYGDFFTGGNGSTLYIDEFELVYDYNDDDPIKIGK